MCIRDRDVLLSYPYQSIRPFIRMLNEAAQDPDVISIKMTLYRVAHESKIIEALISAAENGKEVVAIVELLSLIHIFMKCLKTTCSASADAASTSCAAWVPKAGRAAPSCPILNINRGNNLYER